VNSGSASGGFRVGSGWAPGRIGSGRVRSGTAAQNRGDTNLQCVINLIQTPDLVNVLQEMPPLSTFVYI
jgi:hypothetical protein